MKEEATNKTQKSFRDERASHKVIKGWLCVCHHSPVFTYFRDKKRNDNVNTYEEAHRKFVTKLRVLKTKVELNVFGETSGS